MARFKKKISHKIFSRGINESTSCWQSMELTFPETNSLPLKIGGKGIDDPFLLGPGLYSQANCLF